MTNSEFARLMVKATIWCLVFLLIVGIAGVIAPVHALEVPPPLIIEPIYELTDTERAEVERVVMAEAGGEPYEGQVAVAQCILTACLRTGLRPREAIKEYNYTTARIDPSESFQKAMRGDI